MSSSSNSSDIDYAALAAAASNPAVAAAPPGTTGFLASAARAATFWRRAATVYGAYKAAQVRTAAARAVGVPEADVKADWERTHTWAGDQMRDIALSLGGFYLKVGQLLSNRVDFVAPPVCKALAVLFDAVPPMPGEEVRAIIEAELGAPVDTFFEGLDLGKPLGSASIAQVHKATLRATGQPVAVKVARPGALVMLEDLANIRVAASYLERAELNFDLTAAVDELASQIRKEFDLRLEAAAQDEIGAALAAEMSGRISVPRTIPGLATSRVLVMEYLPGTPLHRLAASDTAPGLPAAVRRAASERIIRTLVDAYGAQLLGSGLFHADPHPGNVLVRTDVASGGRIGLLDFGQVKRLTPEQQAGFARLILALAAAGDPRDVPLDKMFDAMSPEQVQEVADAMKDLGIVTEVTPLGEKCGRSLGNLTVGTAARMFDSRGRVQPFAPNSTIKMLRTKTFPPSLFFVLRTVQMLRGLATAAGVDVSVATLWAPRAARVLGRPPPPARAASSFAPSPAWVGGPVPGGLAPADRAWADGLLGGGKVDGGGGGGRAGWATAPAWAGPAWAAAHGAAALGVAAAVRAAAVAAPSARAAVAASAPLLTLLVATLALQASWPAVLLTARRPSYGVAHGAATLAAAAATAATAAGAVRAAGAALLPLCVGVVAGLCVSAALWAAATRRGSDAWEGDEGADLAAPAGVAASPPPAAAAPAPLPVGVAAAARPPPMQRRRVPPTPRRPFPSVPRLPPARTVRPSAVPIRLAFA